METNEKKNENSKVMFFFYLGMLGICLTSLIMSLLRPLIGDSSESQLAAKTLEYLIDSIIVMVALVKAAINDKGFVFPGSKVSCLGFLLLPALHFLVHHSILVEVKPWEIMLFLFFVINLWFYLIDRSQQLLEIKFPIKNK